MSFLKFKDARKFVRKLGLKSFKDWVEYCESGHRPDFIPSSPNQKYKDNGWEGWPDFWDINIFLENQKNQRIPLKRQEILQGTICSNREWRDYLRSKTKPDLLPSNPSVRYRNEGWISWPDFLGKEKSGRIILAI